MSSKPNLKMGLFDLWGINLMGPFKIAYRCKYMLVVIDYVYKWVEEISLPNNESESVLFLLRKHIFTRFRTA